MATRPDRNYRLRAKINLSEYRAHLTMRDKARKIVEYLWNRISKRVSFNDLIVISTIEDRQRIHIVIDTKGEGLIVKRKVESETTIDKIYISNNVDDTQHMKLIIDLYEEMKKCKLTHCTTDNIRRGIVWMFVHDQYDPPNIDPITHEQYYKFESEEKRFVDGLEFNLNLKFDSRIVTP